MDPFPGDPMKPYPPLPRALRAQLARIEPSVDCTVRACPCRYYPCTVTLTSGARVDRVFLAEARSWRRTHGIWPEEEPGRPWVDVRDVRSVVESPERLPARFANQLYEAGESAMGATFFTVVFADGTKQAYVAGNLIDFITYPPGKGPADLVAVEPHERNAPNRISCPQYHWCLFSDEASAASGLEQQARKKPPA